MWVVLEKGQKAAHDMGITLKTDLVADLKAATEALAAFQASGIHDDVVLTQMKQKVTEAAKAVQEYGKDLSKSNQELAVLDQVAGTFGSKLASGFMAAADGSKAWGQAMEQSTGQAISALGQYCQVQAMASLAKAISEWWNGAASGADFAAAAEWEAAAIACGVAGGMMSGSGGGGGGSSMGGSTGAHGGSIQTSGSGGATGPVVSTTRFAAGGLVTSPTLAMIGDSPSGGSQSEAVLPLENDQAMGRIADAVASRMPSSGGGHTFHVHVKGMVSDDTLNGIMNKMSKKVAKGTGSLTSSNTHRITRRSA